MAENIRPMYTESEVRNRLSGLVHAIAKDHREEEIIVIGLLKGSFIFLADLVRLLHQYHVRMQIAFMFVSSYGNRTVSSGRVQILRDITIDITDRMVLLVDDILDTGRTLHAVTEMLQARQPRTLKTCVFLDKPERRAVTFEADFVGFTIPDVFVVGYGLDCDNRYRELPNISVLTP